MAERSVSSVYAVPNEMTQMVSCRRDPSSEIDRNSHREREEREVTQSMYYSYIITMHSRSACAKWAPLVQL